MPAEGDPAKPRAEERPEENRDPRPPVQQKNRRCQREVEHRCIARKRAVVIPLLRGHLQGESGVEHGSRVHLKQILHRNREADRRAGCQKAGQNPAAAFVRGAAKPEKQQGEKDRNASQKRIFTDVIDQQPEKPAPAALSGKKIAELRDDGDIERADVHLGNYLEVGQSVQA